MKNIRLLIMLMFLATGAMAQKTYEYKYNPNTQKLDWVRSDEFSGGSSSCLWDSLNGNIYYDGGNVGFGVLNPLYKIHVDGDVYGDTARFTHYGGHSNFTIGDEEYLMFMDGEMLMQNLKPSNSDTSVVIDNDTVRYRIDVVPWAAVSNKIFPSTLTDWVGIGTNNPTEMLHVTENVKVEGNMEVGDSIIFSDDFSIHKNGSNLIMNIADNSSGFFEINTASTNLGYNIQFRSDYVRFGSSAAHPRIIGNTPNDSKITFTIKESNNIGIGGNSALRFFFEGEKAALNENGLGIFTATPTEALDINYASGVFLRSFRGETDTDITGWIMTNENGDTCYCYPNAAGNGLTVSTTKP